MFWRHQQKHGRARHVARQLEVFVVPLKPTDEHVQSKRRQDGRRAGGRGREGDEEDEEEEESVLQLSRSHFISRRC